MRWRKMLVSVVVFAATLELILQIGAAVASTMVRPASRAKGPSVVCLGDSYTAGIGASTSEASYPSRLENRLRALGHDVTVINGGCPGKDSAFMLRRLPRLLGPETRVLCLLMAFNDTWAHPGRVSPDELARMEQEDTGAFEWRWRTGRLVALCTGFAENSWHRTSEEIAATEPHGEPDPTLRDPEAGFRLLERGGLIEPNAPPPDPLPTPPVPLARAIHEIEQRMLADDPIGALGEARELAERHPDQGVVLRTLAVTAHAAGERALADEALGKLAKLAAAGDPAAGENEIFALVGTERIADALARASSFAVDHPRSLTAWLALFDSAVRLGRAPDIRRAAPKVLGLAGRLLPAQSAAVARALAVVDSSGNRDRAALLLVAATLLDGDVAATRAKIRSVRRAVPWEVFGATIDGLDDLPAPDRKALAETLRAAHRGEEGRQPWAETLRDHMRMIGRLCRRRHIELVVLEYPFPHPVLEAIQREFAAEFGAHLVPIRERFDRELKTRRREELFVANGHCNDAGYALVAEMTASVVAPLLRD